MARTSSTSQNKTRTSYAEKKSARNISVTQIAWDNLSKEADAIGCSVSELIEQRGRNQSLLELPIVSRLQLTLQPPNTFFWSLSEFIRRSGRQLGLLISSDDPETDKKNECDLVCRVLRTAMPILVLLDDAIPHSYIRDLIPLLRLLTWKSLRADAPPAPQGKPETLFSSKDRNLALQKFKDALSELREISPQHYDILQMRYVGGLSTAQIAKFKTLNGDTTTELAMGAEIKKALFQFRRILHLWQTQPPSKHEHGFIHKRASAYYELCGFSFLRESDRDAMEKFLEDSLLEQTLDFSIREVDHWAGHQLLEGDSISSIHLNESYVDQHEAVRRELEASLETDLDTWVKAMNGRLRLCKTSSQIREALDVQFAEITGTSLMLKDIPLADAKTFMLT